MCGSKQNPWLCGLGALLAVLVVYGGRAQADVTSDRAGSAIFFPKVIADGTRDTVIQLGNVGNAPYQAHCFYIDAGCVATPDFDVFLTKQQPTIWRVSTGRPDDNTYGLAPGLIPPAPLGFKGQLLCVEVDTNDVPYPGNHFKGEAVIYSLDGTQQPGNLSEYNGISVISNGAGSNVLDFVASGSAGYNACPKSLLLNHYAEGFEDKFTGGAASTELTLIPCTALLEQVQPLPAKAHFDAVDEMEFSLSTDVDVGCFVNTTFESISTAVFGAHTGHTLLKTRISPTAGSVCYSGALTGAKCTSNTGCPGYSGVCMNDVTIPCTVDSQCGTGTCRVLGCLPRPGLLGVAEEFQTRTVNTVTGPAGTAAVNLFVEGSQPGDFIVLPPAK